MSELEFNRQITSNMEPLTVRDTKILQRIPTLKSACKGALTFLLALLFPFRVK